MGYFASAFRDDKRIERYCAKLCTVPLEHWVSCDGLDLGHRIAAISLAGAYDLKAQTAVWRGASDTVPLILFPCAYINFCILVMAKGDAQIAIADGTIETIRRYCSADKYIKCIKLLNEMPEDVDDGPDDFERFTHMFYEELSMTTGSNAADTMMSMSLNNWGMTTLIDAVQLGKKVLIHYSALDLLQH